MNVIALSKRKFENLEPLKLARGVYSTESQVYMFHYKGEEKVVKKFFYQNGERFANKLYTLEMLSYYKKYLPESFCIPDAQISVAGIVQGFTLPYIDGVNLTTFLNNKEISLDDKKYYLAKVGDILNQLKAIRNSTPINDIYIGDLHSSNFLVTNNKTLKVVDLDSCKIKNNTSFVSRYLNTGGLLKNVLGKYKFINDPGEMGEVEVDENTDLYCYSLMILNFLYGLGVDRLSLEDFYNYMNYLELIGVNDNLVNSFRTLISNKDNINPKNYLDDLTEEQVVRAKGYVYQKVKNRYI